MIERGHIQLEGSPVQFGDGGFRLRTNNLRRWTGFFNGASLVSEWNGEREVAQLGYDPDTDAVDLSGIKYATFTTTIDVGPTASAICTEVDLEVGCNNQTDSRYWVRDGAFKTPVNLQTAFTAAGGVASDNAQKPSTLQMLAAVWFEYDGPLRPVGPNHGVFEIGIGGGDLIFFENLTTGGIAWLFTGTNELDTSPPPQSVDWCDSPQVTWLQMPLSGLRDDFRVSIRPPGHGKNPAQAGADIDGSPGGLRYYLQIYIIDGCSLIPGTLTRGDILGGAELPFVDKTNNSILGASDSSVML